MRQGIAVVLEHNLPLERKRLGFTTPPRFTTPPIRSSIVVVTCFSVIFRIKVGSFHYLFPAGTEELLPPSARAPVQQTRRVRSTASST
jgi:hypothetical protein